MLCVFGWFLGFFGAAVIAFALALVVKGIWKFFKLIRSATRKGAARYVTKQTGNR